MRSPHSSCDDGRRIFEGDVRVEDTLSVSKVVCDAGRGMCTGSVSLKVALALRLGFRKALRLGPSDLQRRRSESAS
jgi:hypothetical protein